METIAGFMLLWGAFNYGAKTEIEKPKPPIVTQSSVIQQAGEACDSGSMRRFQKGSLEFECTSYSTEERDEK